MRIETASGHTILADNADYPLIRDYQWWISKHANGRLYACAHVPGSGTRLKRRIKMHRLLMQPPPELIVHHKNNNGLDNRRSNLQVTTTRVNIRYAHMSCDRVYQQDGRWRAQPRDETGNRISLGGYDTKEEASAVVQNWRYRKMLELEKRGDRESMDLAALIWEDLKL